MSESLRVELDDNGNIVDVHPEGTITLRETVCRDVADVIWHLLSRIQKLEQQLSEQEPHAEV